MNLLIPGALVTTLLLPVPPLVPALAQAFPARSATERVSVAHGWPEPVHPAATWPLEPRPEVVAGFAPAAVNWSAGHRGVDLLGSPGAEVLAPLAGRISFAGTIAGRGVVVVDHGGYRTTYEPVLALVRRGDHVAAGQPIGTLQTGRSHCAPRSCLHWGLIRDGVYRDPLTLVRTAAVRLLPLEPQARG
ncbi:murein hydrolase activator EnvC family protein [Nocardioides marmorisolisilvae]|uniref:M23 family metallopeptidase n=1 Tax=Nocardioides marmorisolisilvae TaxID=1542737 RepID=A0A3N0DWL2_9ACTN|nr:M23 family metallopeptidase [Nocardioides marmorisolisilvae]RNL79833.1 M23 family metallopeptidase [Nocardioides marmorisolisilvae]